MDATLASFIVAHTRHPKTLTRAANYLGPLVTDVVPAIAFEPDWVLAQQKKGRALAVYAAEHCDDPALQERLWAKPRYVDVRQALAASYTLDEELRLRWYDDPATSDFLRDLLRDPQRRDNAAALVSYVLSTRSKQFLQGHRPGPRNLSVEDVLDHPRLSDQQCNDLVRHFLRHGNSRVLFDCLRRRWHARSHRYYAHLAIQLCTLSTDEILALAPADELPATINRVLGYDHADIAMTSDDFRLAMRYTDSVTLRHRYAPIDVTNRFDDETISLLLSSPGWKNVAALGQLSDEQFEQFLAACDWSESLEELLVASHVTSPDRLRQVALAMPAHHRSGVSWHIWTKEIDLKLLPKEEVLLFVARSGLLEDYLGNGLRDPDLSIPSLEETKELLRLYEVDGLRLATVLWQSDGEIPEANVEALVRYVPRLPSALLETTPTEPTRATRALERLLTAELPEHYEAALEMIQRAQAGFEAVRAAFAALARAAQAGKGPLSK